jgi:hypothetical protein
MKDARSITLALGGKWHGKYGQARCPAHDDHDPSLSIRDGERAPLFTCHAGCSSQEVADKLHKSKILDGESKSSWKPNGNTTPVSQIANHHYVDEHGETLFVVERLEPKGFRQRRPDGNGGWIWSIGETRRVLYRLPEVLEAIASDHPIFIAEGEKGVDALVGIGVTATCSPSGAEKWRDEHSQYLKGADVVIVPDNDASGEKHCIQVMKSLTGIASNIRVLRLKGLPHKGDPFDWIQAGGNATELWNLVESTSIAPEPEKSDGLIFTCAANVKPRAVEWLWRDRLPLGKCTLQGGDGGIGKSLLIAWIAATTSRGGDWPNGEGTAPAGSVIILSAEDDMEDTIVPRLMAAGADLSRIHILNAVIAEDGNGRRVFNLKTDLQRLEARIKQLGDCVLVAIDPINSYLGETDSFKNGQVRTALEPVGEMAARLRVTILGNTHFNKSGAGGANKRFIDSVAFINHARAGFVVVEDKDNPSRKLFIPSKHNLGPRKEGLAYTIDTKLIESDEPIRAPVVKWENEVVKLTADEAVCATKGEGKSELDKAKTALRKILSGKEVMQEEAMAEAINGYFLAEKTVRQAANDLGVISKPKEVGGKWYWRLP